MIPNTKFWDLLFHSGNIIYQTPRAMCNEDTHYSIIYNNKHCIKAKCPTTGEQFCKLWCSNMKGYYGAIKMIIMKTVATRHTFMRESKCKLQNIKSEAIKCVSVPRA